MSMILFVVYIQMSGTFLSFYNKSHVIMAIPRRMCLESIYVVEQNNSILRGLLVMKTYGWSDKAIETYVNTDC
jgi:hypothetical protein